MILVRQEIGDVLRDLRLQKGRTLRQVAGRASVALGYLSEVERGQKEASSEILASVAEALDTPISVIMREVGDRIAVLEGIDVIPDTVPVSSWRTSTPTSWCTDRGSVRVSEFRRAVSTEFGEGLGIALTRDLVLAEFGHVSANEAIAAGADPRDVWLALCRAAEVPRDRWYGAGLKPPRD